MGKVKNIFRDGNRRFKEITRQYSLTEVLVLAIEIGKFNSKGLIANMYGDLVQEGFDFPNSLRGYHFLRAQIEKSLNLAQAKRVFIGMEGTGHYHENLALRLKDDGFSVEILNPYDAKQERENKNAKTDKIDLLSIARMLITNKGRRALLSEGVYNQLKVVSRNRRKLVGMRTSLKNKITCLVDVIFPGYWPKEADEEIFSNHWGKASLLLLEHYPHPEQVRLLGVEKLVTFLKKHNTKLGLETAEALVEAAKNSLHRPLKETESHCLALKCLLRSFRTLSENIEELEREMARLLMQTPGLYLLSVPGISALFAAELVGEVGNIGRFSHPGQIMSFAGTVPYVSQSAEYESQGLPLTKKGAKGLRPLLNQIALSLNTHCPQFRGYYQVKHLQKSDRPGIAKIATGNKFIRLAFCLMKQEKLFVPEGFDPSLMDLKEQQLSAFEEVQAKLKRNGLKPADLLGVEPNYFTKIKAKLEEIYGVESLQANSRA